MNKIKWTEEELKKIIKPYVICEECGWLVSNHMPNPKEKCANCGAKYLDAVNGATKGGA